LQVYNIASYNYGLVALHLEIKSNLRCRVPGFCIANNRKNDEWKGLLTERIENEIKEYENKFGEAFNSLENDGML